MLQLRDYQIEGIADTRAAWPDRDVRDAFSDAVCAAVEREHPDAFAAEAAS